jgi:alkanesulfonate monooxygenase SsuD/methylene tetrahydromethanopterin reductase-like flavin-dependent oxidoreductase (luciferase family)
MTRAAFDASLEPRGANFVGNPEQVAEKIVQQHGIFGHQRFLIQFSVGTLPHADVMHSIELYGTEVAPLVRREIDGIESAATAAAQTEGAR